MKRGMNIHNAKVWITACFAMFLAACADGTAPIAEVTNPNITPPVISLKVESLADPTRAGEAIAIDTGTGVKLTWEVSGADTVELASNSDVMKSHTVDPSGSETVDALSANTAFTLTASVKGAPFPRSVNVVVASPTPNAQVLDFQAIPAELKAGESTKLCYVVLPKDAKVTIIDKDSGAIVPPATVGGNAAVKGPLFDTSASAVMKLSLAAMPRSADMPPTVSQPPITTPVIPISQPHFPLASPTATPSDTPSVEPSSAPSSVPSDLPSMMPSDLPTAMPTDLPLPPESPLPEVTETAQPTPEVSAEPSAPPVDSDTLSGCSIEIQPAAGAHTYVLNVTDANGGSASQETSVTVASELSVNLRVNDSSSATLPKPGTVTLSWSVKPSDAKLSLAPVSSECDAAALSQEGIGRCEVKVASSTTYTLTASDASGQEQSASVQVTVESNVVSAPKLSADRTDVFAGESVTFTVADASASGELVSPDGQTTPLSGGSVTVTPQANGGYYVNVFLNTTAASTADVVASNPINVNVRSWGAAGDRGNAWYAVAINAGNGGVIAGSSANVAQESEGAKWATSAVDVPKTLSADSKVPADWLGKFGTYQINAFAFDSKKNDGKRVYAAAIGGVLVSNDGGNKWGPVDNMLVYENSDNPRYRDAAEVHTGCKGSTQTGTNSSLYPVINVVQSCDVVVDATGRLIAALDRGVVYVDDVDRMLASPNEVAAGWKGVPRPGQQFDMNTNLLGMIVNDLELMNGVLFAATNHGVFYSAQAGNEGSWQVFSGGDLGKYDLATHTGDAKAVNAAVADLKNRMVYAGSADGGLYARTTDLAGEGWKKVGAKGKSILSLAIDASNGALLIGTDDGAYLSRDGGQTITNISVSMGLKEGAKAVAALAASNGVYAAATAQGVFVSRGMKASAPTASPSPSPSASLLMNTGGTPTVVDAPAPGSSSTPAPAASGASGVNGAIL